MIQLYDTERQSLTELKPIVPGKVGLYVCGVTVYDVCHVGHARVYVFFDTLKRFLSAEGLNVTYVRNITDIDDKIIKRAQERNIPIDTLTEQTIAKMHTDLSALNIHMPDLEPRATESIPEIVNMIQALVDKGHAYQSDSGDVCFSVKKHPRYGELSHQSIDDLVVGSRAKADTQKENPLDFVLWKPAKAGEPYWPSPWGNGRPGWHIECSAMTKATLGGHFDIHGGGKDLVFPHHENERAQSMCANECDYVNHWMHVGFVNIDDEKMSKSLNNFTTIEQALEQYPADVIRYFLLASHYRSPLTYSSHNLNNAQNAILTLYGSLRGRQLEGQSTLNAKHPLTEKFLGHLRHDMATPEAFAVLFEMANGIHKTSGDEQQALAHQLKACGYLLGILQMDPEAFFQRDTDKGLAEWVEAQIEARKTARAEKRWSDADKIRDELLEKGIILEDGPDGTTWKVS